MLQHNCRNASYILILIAYSANAFTTTPSNGRARVFVTPSIVQMVSTSSDSSSIAEFLRDPQLQSNVNILQEPSEVPTIEVMDDYVNSATVVVPARGTTMIEEVMMPIISTSLLITANTVGAGTMILPNVAAGPGFAAMVAAFVGVWILNLISSLLISDIAIQQYESSGCQSSAVPSSFKEFADVTIGTTAGNIMAGISLFTNMCVLAFALMTSGEVVHGILEAMNVNNLLDQHHWAATGLLTSSSSSSVIAASFAVAISILSMTLPNGMLSSVSSACATVLFLSFAAVVFPGVYNIGDPILAVSNIAPPCLPDTDLLSSLKNVLPIMITVSTYQNITPTVTKLLNFDRFQVVVATILGSAIPVGMYIVWMYVNMAGGVAGTDQNFMNLMINAFMASSLVGSSIACTISIAEEFESLLSDDDSSLFSFFTGADAAAHSDSNNAECVILDEEPAMVSTDQVLSVPSVLMSVIPCLVAGLLFSEGGAGGFNAALDVAGKYGSTVLYGLFPVALGLTQRQRSKNMDAKQQQDSLVPGGIAPMAMLGAATAFYIGNSCIADMGDLFLKSGLGIVS